MWLEVCWEIKSIKYSKHISQIISQFHNLAAGFSLHHKKMRSQLLDGSNGDKPYTAKSN